MKNLLFFLSLISIPSFAQKIHQSAEVTQPAQPAGGAQLLELFIASNLRLPVKPTDGTVTLLAVVEPDGSATGIRVKEGLDSLCNAEAIRVLRLYKAWKPAMLDSRKVRQEVVVPVVFKCDSPEGFSAASHSIVTYYRHGIRSAVESATIRRSIPVDDFGFLSGNVVFQKKEENRWVDVTQVPLQITGSMTQFENEGIKDSVQTLEFSANLPPQKARVYQIIKKQLNGALVSLVQMDPDDKAVFMKDYHLNGALKSLKIYGKELNKEYTWYGNGQLATFEEKPVMLKKPNISYIWEVYDKAGNQLVTKGNGYLTPDNKEYGLLKSGLREGIWKGTSADSSRFEEEYNAGKLEWGKTFLKDKVIAYDEVEVMPQYKGGFPAMYKFIAKNVKYPKDAAKQNISGQVFTTFVVRSDGTIGDVALIQGLHESMDKEALRVVTAMSGHWEPGWQRGRKVNVKFNIPINFYLE
ncbi:energy transducer TonB [Dyadobacter sandarakinus]|uniref:TonB family protein n=1 Tax=Dyadobacter sandarakinus TaxID=2747268 RepID=A0ABX7IA35_9BACT|nr:energy transducer TonB [Dyadobacter sandarakinus]QRR02775.1 TonB family protein [Dyadobacter sandarakinus]